LPVAGLGRFKLTNQAFVSFMVRIEQGIVKVLCYDYIAVGVEQIVIVELFVEQTNAST
jgi:hypothetical protein